MSAVMDSRLILYAHTLQSAILKTLGGHAHASEHSYTKNNGRGTVVA